MLPLVLLDCRESTVRVFETVLAGSAYRLHRTTGVPDSLALVVEEPGVLVVDGSSPALEAGLIDALAANRRLGVIVVADGDGEGQHAARGPRTVTLNHPVTPGSVTRALETLGREAGHELAPRPVDDASGPDPLEDRFRAAIPGAAASRGVLIVGEPGTGRHRLARAIHRARGTQPGPFVVASFTGRQPGEADASLFGMPPSGPAASPATRNAYERVMPDGMLHAARGGTICADGIADLSARTQGRLALVLRDGEVAVGRSVKPQALDVLFIVVADPDIEQQVGDGRIRVDLYKRLAACRLDVPPLRSRRGEIPAIARLILRDLGGSTPRRELSPAAASLLSAFPWRRNEIDLRDALRALLSRPNGADTVIGLDEVLESLRFDGGIEPGITMAPPPSLRQARTLFEREYITAVLQHHHGRIPEAARALGIQRTNLYRKLRSLSVGMPGGLRARRAGGMTRNP
jgi:DNA-binding NtrC family response regulator